MGEVLTFTPRPQPALPPAPDPEPATDLRARIEAVAEAAVDLAQQLIATLDRIDGDPDLEDGGDAEPSLAAPEGLASQVGWCRGGDGDRKAEAREAVLPEVVCAAVQLGSVPESSVPDLDPVALALAPLLRWGGRGNVVAAVGVVLLDLVSGTQL